MGNNQKEPKLIYALNKSGKLVNICNAETGIKYRCPECKKHLISKIGHGKRQPHFAHHKDSNCPGAIMTVVHMLAEEVIEENKAVMVPVYKEIEAKSLSFINVEVEQRKERKDLQPDLVGITEDGKRWHIEIRNTHGVDDVKKEKLLESKITCLEIDVSKQKQDKDALKSFLLESAEDRCWINNPNYDEWIVEEKRKRVSMIVQHLTEESSILIPAYKIYASKKICLDSVSVLNDFENGLWVRLKATSLGETYIFDIGSREMLDMNPQGEEENCNELAIYTDNLSDEIVNPLDILEVEWLRHVKSDNEEKERIKAYESNPNFELRPLLDCKSREKCKYTPYGGECIYKIDTIDYYGNYYVVCNKEKRLRDDADSPQKPRIQDSFSKDVSPKLERCEDNQKEELKTNVTVKRFEPVQKEEQRDNSSYMEDDPFAFEDLSSYSVIDGLFKKLRLATFYKTASGDVAIIVKCDKVGDRIIVLYENLNETKSYPYHIDDIKSTDKGEVIQNKVCDYINKSTAMKGYDRRLDDMRKTVHVKQPARHDNIPPPF